mmetsp:Transcript_27490/g.46130  ORF Transcript_27490/g.46130 Transcript_27490/m.46130 type:complete len:290 (-) Transcript_27490:1567-2436(-)
MPLVSPRLDPPPPPPPPILWDGADVAEVAAAATAGGYTVVVLVLNSGRPMWPLLPPPPPDSRCLLGIPATAVGLVSLVLLRDKRDPEFRVMFGGVFGRSGWLEWDRDDAVEEEEGTEVKDRVGAAARCGGCDAYLEEMSLLPLLLEKLDVLPGLLDSRDDAALTSELPSLLLLLPVLGPVVYVVVALDTEAFADSIAHLLPELVPSFGCEVTAEADCGWGKVSSATTVSVIVVVVAVDATVSSLLMVGAVVVVIVVGGGGGEATARDANGFDTTDCRLVCTPRTFAWMD